MEAGNRTLIFSLALCALLSGCGGGGSDAGDPGTGAPPQPVLVLTPQATKTFHFTWTDVAGETSYKLMEDATGASGYIEVAQMAANAAGHDLSVFLPGRINARYYLRACNDNGCSDSATVQVSGTLVAAIGRADASNTGEGAVTFPVCALSADGGTLVVGASAEDSNATGINGSEANSAAEESGAAYVFVRQGASWTRQAYIKASNTGADDGFGGSVALSADGNTLAVGAREEDSNATGINGDQSSNSAAQSGAAYIFTRQGATWSQQAYIKSSNSEADDRFGFSVALSADGDTLVASATGEASNATGINGNQASNAASISGAAYVFVRQAGAWSQQAYVKASNTGTSDFFGWSVALSGNGDTLAIGALLESSNATGINGADTNNLSVGSGAVYVFVRQGAVWSQQAYVKASNTGVEDSFGSSVALSTNGDTLAVGAYQEDSGATGINGDQSSNAVADSGAAYVFARQGTTWSQQAYLKASNTGADDSLGYGVIALSGDGDTLAVGAFLEDGGATGINGDATSNAGEDSGAAYVFVRRNAAWIQQAYVKAPNLDVGYFAAGMALSADGGTLAVGDLSFSPPAGYGAVHLY